MAIVQESTNTQLKSSLMRHQIMDLMNIGAPSDPKWALMGVGFTSIDENPNAQTDTVAFVSSRNASTDTIGYQVSFPFSTRVFKEEEATMKLHYIATNHDIGAASLVEYMRVDLFPNQFDPNLSQYDQDEYRARKFVVAVAVSSISGDGASPIVVEGDLNTQGDFILGKFNVRTREFTPISA